MTDAAPPPIVPTRRTRVCLSCRTLYGDDERCPGKKHVTVSLEEAAGRRSLDDEVWGPDSRARKMRQAAKAGAGGAGIGSLFQGCDLPTIESCDGGEGLLVVVGVIVFAVVAIVLFKAVRALVRWIREKLRKPKPHGALLGPPRPKSAVVAGGGVVRSGAPLSIPWMNGSAVAYAMELFGKNVFGGGAMLRDAATAGFDVALDDGRVLRIPPGRIRVLGRLPRVAVDRARVASMLGALVPSPDEGHEERDLFPFDYVRGQAIGPGDRVDVLGEIEITSDGRDGGYRSAPVVTPVGVPVLRVRARGTHDEPRLRVGDDDGQAEAEAEEPSSSASAARR